MFSIGQAGWIPGGFLVVFEKLENLRLSWKPLRVEVANFKPVDSSLYPS